MSHSDDKLVKDLIECLQKREKIKNNNDLITESVSELLDEPINIKWEGLYDRLRSGYHAIQKEMKNRSK